MGKPQACPECGGHPVSEDGRFGCSFCNGSGTVESQPDARAKLDWDAALRNLRAVASPYFTGEQLDAAFDQLVDAVEALCVKAKNEEWKRQYGVPARDTVLENFQLRARRLVRGKDGDDG